MKTIILAALLLSPAALWAQADTVSKGQLTVDAQLMSRGELRRGGFSTQAETPNADKASFITERARLMVGFRREALSLLVSFQHEGLWGMEGAGNNFKLHEAWGQLTAPNGLFARIGRQEMRYDDERILGNNDWAMAALSHDALKVGYEGHGHKLHAFGAYNQNGKNRKGGTYYTDGAQPYKSLVGAWYHYDFNSLPFKFFNHLGVSLIAMNVGMQAGTEESYHTVSQQLFGGYLTYKPKRLLVELSYYRQAGKASLNYESGNTLPLKAWMGSVKATYDVSPVLTAYAGYDYLSGDKDFVVPQKGNIGMTQHKELNAFTSVFGSAHKFYGAMDFFYVSAYHDTNSPGLQNLFAGAKVRPVKGLSLDAAYHYMAITSDVAGLKKTLGHEVELTAQYRVMRDVSLSAGYTFMIGSEAMEQLKRTNASRRLHWAWLMVNITPNIFKR